MKNAELTPARAVQIAVVVSLLVLLAGAWLVLQCWFPQALWKASGVLDIATYALWAHVGITALLFLPWRNRRKDPRSARSDIAFLVFVMFCGALFSLSYFFAGRPVALVFAVDRVALVRANEIRTNELAFPGALSNNLRVSGPLQLIAARPSSDAERLNSIQLAMTGFDLHQRPGFWVDIETQRDLLVQKAQGIGNLGDSLVRKLATFDEIKAEWAFFIPLEGVSGNWVLVLDAELRTFAPVKLE